MSAVRKEAQVDEGRCRGCNKRILWARTEKGARMPLDPEKVTVCVETGQNDVVKVMTGYTSHFATCPAASQFRGRRETARCETAEGSTR